MSTTACGTEGLLESIQIAKPCGADWDAMRGDARVRFCGLCSLNVYNLSGMPRAEAEALVRATEGKICVRLYKRTDGTVLTQDCPVGIAAIKRRFVLAASGFGAFLTAAAGVAVGARHWRELFPAKPVVVQGLDREMGKIARPLMGAAPVAPRPTPAPIPTTPPGGEIGESSSATR